MKGQQGIREALGRATSTLTAAKIRGVLSLLPPRPMGGREKLESIKNLKGRITYCKQRELTLGNDQNFDDAGASNRSLKELSSKNWKLLRR